MYKILTDLKNLYPTRIFREKWHSTINTVVACFLNSACNPHVNLQFNYRQQVNVSLFPLTILSNKI